MVQYLSESAGVFHHASPTPPHWIPAPAPQKNPEELRRFNPGILAKEWAPVAGDCG